MMNQKEIAGFTVDQAWVVGVLTQMPLASASDLAGVGRLTQVRCGQILKELERRGCSMSVRLGATRPVQNRWFLTRAGIRKAFPYHTGRVPWYLSESGLKNLIRRLPMLEQFYMLATSLINSPDVLLPETTIPASIPELCVDPPTDRCLQRFQWLRSSTIHAVVHYHRQLVIPLVWVGHWGPSPAWKKYDEGEHARGLWYFSPTLYTGGGNLSHQTQPSAWAVVGIDTWALDEGCRALPWEAPHAYFMDGELLYPLHLQASVMEIYDEKPDGAMGIPEHVVNWANIKPEQKGTEHDEIEDEELTVVGALNGMVAFNAFTFVEEWPSARAADIARWCGQPPSKMRKVLRRLVKVDLLAEFDGHYYLGYAGMSASARQGRISPRTVRAMFETFVTDSDHRRRQYRIHDRKLAQMASFWRSCGLLCIAGRRGQLVVPGEVTLDPDARFRLGGNRDQKPWHFLEYERSATSPSQVINKLEGYRSFYEQEARVPLMVVCDNAAAEQVFWDVAGDMDLMTSTYDRAMKGDLLERLTFRSPRGQISVLSGLEEVLAEDKELAEEAAEGNDAVDRDEVPRDQDFANADTDEPTSDDDEVLHDDFADDLIEDDGGAGFPDDLWWHLDASVYPQRPSDLPVPPWANVGLYEWAVAQSRANRRYR